MDDVQSATWIRNSIVQCVWQNFVPKSQQAARKLYRTRSAVKMTEVTLESRHRNSPCRVADSPVVASRFDQVVSLGALAVSVDVADLVGFQV